jgi:glycosyltransferase involved in cell wall biosynthesis
LKILFLSTHNLATNPRLVKEIGLALDNSFSVEVICFEFENWSKENNEKLKQELANVKFITVPAGRKPYLPWVLSVVKEQISRKLILLFKSEKILANAVSRRSSLIIKNLNKVSKPDWVIGHNPGALYATKFAAEKFNCQAGFDVEDYHAGEGSNVFLQNLSRKLMHRVLPKMSYVSFAAPLIMKEVQKEATAGNKNWFTVLNLFPASEFIEPTMIDAGRLKMIWFSQNVSRGRGLELVLPYIKSSAEVELHLVGNMDKEFFEEKLSGQKNIIVHAPLSQIDLHHSLSNFDVGLALEPAKDRNNELAVSNKMLAYFQSGLYVVATNTPAQQAFLREVPQHGVCFDYGHNNFEQVIATVLKDRDKIRKEKHQRFNNFSNRGWNEESLKLVEAWKSGKTLENNN